MRLGYLGVGNMGNPMAGKFLDAGHEVWVFDARPEAMAALAAQSARATASPRELGDRCETVFVSLPTLDAFRETVMGAGGVLEGKALKTLVNTCTVGAPFVDKLVVACEKRGIAVIDSPITGGPAAAAAGTLAVMVSGDSRLIAELQPLLKLWGKTVVIAGDRPGAAQVLKLTNNILFAVSVVASAEAMVMGARAGLSIDAMLEVVNNGSGRNFATMSIFPKSVVPGTFDFGAPLEMLLKDVDLAIEQGDSLGIPMWVCQAAQHLLREGVSKGRARHDLSRTIHIIEDGADGNLTLER